jgi:hypothetical protein
METAPHAWHIFAARLFGLFLFAAANNFIASDIDDVCGLFLHATFSFCVG